ncbi:PPC domain-containing protein [Spirulina subsalsa FACHB-351]|uniref:PPC domain-containing protein n=1 Tax=Spirulina subsalsa FACHB-351 TaxID=234711 RepID=A0ABT3L8M0_9CYAN|nr:PPC domain-containing protein [Spirulina subsalsa]MCW6037834.1 PPC domain-containing protein [Spirulina subsalsa FACHB-351]
MIKNSRFYIYLGLSCLFSLMIAVVGENVVKANPILNEQGRIEESDAKLEDGSFYDLYTFPGEAGQRVRIRLESEDFDPYLVLFNSQGEKLADADDISPEDWNAELEYLLPEDGVYQVIVNSYNPEGRGEYNLVIYLDPETSIHQPQ